MVLWSGGCEEEQANLPQDVKTARLISAENIQHKHEIEQLKKQIEEQKQQLDKCNKERQEWQTKAEKGLQEEVAKMTSISMEGQAQVAAENEQLKAEIARLKGEKPEAPAPPEAPESNENVPAIPAPPAP
jgi:TolA-binding protein